MRGVASDGHPYRDPERRLRGRNGWGGASRPAPQSFWRESDKSQVREGSALASIGASFLIGQPPG